MIQIPEPHETCTCGHSVWTLDRVSFLSQSRMTNAWWRCDFCHRMVVAGHIPDKKDADPDADAETDL